MNQPSDIDLLLIGKTGNGKSATGNSILRRPNAFKAKSSTTSVTTEVDFEVSEFNGRVIKVVDGPGVGDTRMSDQAAVDMVMSEMEYAITANPSGYHAFLLVVRFGCRFTEEDKSTISFLKQIFGQNFVKGYCILVLTCGDNFEKEEMKSLKAWCDEQTGVFRDLLNECNNRVVIFDNRTKDTRKINDQVAHLIKMVDNLSSSGSRYTDDNFSRTKEVRDRVLVEARKPFIQEETTRETSLILQKVREVQEYEVLEMKIRPLEVLHDRALNLYKSIRLQDRGTGALHDMRVMIKSLERQIRDDLQFCKKMKVERTAIRQLEEDTRTRYEETMRKQREQLEKAAAKDQEMLQTQRRVEREQEKQNRERKSTMIREQAEAQRRLIREMQEERRKQDQKYEDLEEQYRNAKAENNKSIFAKVVNAFTMPFRAIKARFSSNK